MRWQRAITNGDLFSKELLERKDLGLLTLGKSVATSCPKRRAVLQSAWVSCQALGEGLCKRQRFLSPSDALSCLPSASFGVGDLWWL